MTDLVLRLEERVTTFERNGLRDHEVVSLLREAAHEIIFLRSQLRNMSTTGAGALPGVMIARKANG